MKVLIVDDTPKRYQELCKTFESEGSADDELTIVTDGMVAREKLSETKYDLLVLDILIPLRAQEEANAQNSRDLLEELIDEDDLLKPNKILGLTADQSAAEEVSSFFEDNTWRLIRYDSTSDSWSRQIKNCIRYLRQSVHDQPRKDYDFDVAVLCALKTPELDAILRLSWNWSELKPISDNLFAYEGTFFSKGKKFKIVAGYCTRMGIVSSAVTASRLIETCRPRHLLMAGICGGVQGKVRLGSAILADPTWDWQSGKFDSSNQSNRFAVSPHHLPVDHSIRAAMDSLAGDKSFCREIQDNWPGDIPSEFSIVAGPMASGSAVLADTEMVSRIRNFNRDLIALDMEAYGLYAAAHQASLPRPIPFAVKSVCDFANADKNDDYQAYAAYTSAQTIKRLLEQFYCDWITL